MEISMETKNSEYEFILAEFQILGIVLNNIETRLKQFYNEKHPLLEKSSMLITIAKKCDLIHDKMLNLKYCIQIKETE